MSVIDRAGQVAAVLDGLSPEQVARVVKLARDGDEHVLHLAVDVIRTLDGLNQADRDRVLTFINGTLGKPRRAK